MTDDILTALAAAATPADKAALIAEFALADLPSNIATVARRVVILHWFNTDILAALLPAGSPTPAAVYQRLAGLPFIEHLSYGLAYHDLTRTGLLARYTASQPDLLREAAALAAPVYAAYTDKTVTLEALYCYTLAGHQTEAGNLLDELMFWAAGREDWATLLNSFEIRDEAERYAFVEKLPRVALHYFARGFTYYKQEQYDEALADYSEAIRLNPEYATAFSNRGLTYDELEQYDEALADYSEAIRLNPEDATAFSNRGNTYYKQEQYDEALADYSEAIRLNPEDATAFYNTACVYALQNKIVAALPPLRRTLELNPSHFLTLIPTDSDFDFIRTDPRFQALLAEFGKPIDE